ncbi:MAG: NUDIX hydrolase [Clostridia bacterium]|nr:NUDIX hydrolase [Clostridia bacterium]
MKENTEANTEPKAGVKAEPKAEEELRRLREVQTESRKVFDGVLLHVRQDTVRLPNGASSIREVIRHVGAVCVIPVTEDGGVIMERQYRYPLDRVILEIPAGKLDAPEEDRLSAIRRELREETGYTADEWIPLGDFHPAPAYSDEYITMYLARGLHPGKQALDEDEFLDLYTIPLAELVREVMDGRISDAKTQVAVLKAARLLGL